jgi:glycosyltransferase involved in cell wall biosynthesis
MAAGKWSTIKQTVKYALGRTFYQQHLDQVERYLVKNKIQAVLANYAVTAFPIMEICDKHNIPLLVHFHGWTAYRQSMIEQRRHEYQRLFQVAKAIIGVSDDMVAQLKALGASENKLHQTVYGYNPDTFGIHENQSDSLLYLSVGRFCDTKNHHLTILAFAKVLLEFPAARLHIWGGHENLLFACYNLVKALKIEHAVDFKGIGKPEQIAAAMQNAFCFVQHSATTPDGEKEGTPVAIIEAMASGLPVVATRHAGISDIITDGETGLLCDEFNLDQMANNMIKLAKDRNLSRKIGIKAAEYARTKLTMENYINDIHKVICEVIK